MSPQSIGAGIFGIILVVVALAGVLYLVRESALLRRMRTRGISTTAAVVGHRRRDNNLDQAVIAFVDQRGQQVEFVPKRALLNEFVPEGQRFQVVYLPEAPEKARLDKLETRQRSLLLLASCLVLVFGIGALLLTGVLPHESTTVARSGDPFVLLFALGTILVGLGVLALYGRRFHRLLALRNNGVPTTGTVTRTVSPHDGGKQALIEFVDADQRRIQFTSSAAPRMIGATVRLVYWPDRPQKAEVAPVLRNTGGFVFCTLISLVFVVGGVFMFITA